MTKSGLVIEKLVDYTPGQLECMAEEFLRRRVDVPDRIPVDIELLLENSKDVLLVVKPNLVVGHSVEGCVCSEYMSTRLFVFVDKNIADGHNDPRYLEVLAEELAHIEIHRGLIHQIDSVERFVDARRHPHWQRIEKDANTFSAAIRIPTKHLIFKAEFEYQTAVQRLGFKDSYAILQVITNQLAERFAVPPATMRRRLSQWPFDWFGEAVRASVIGQSERLLTKSGLQEIRQRTWQKELFDSPATQGSDTSDAVRSP